MEDLRSRWELPSIAHFVATFHRIFHLPELHVEELETAFLTSCTVEGSDLINQLLASLLVGFYSSKNIEFYNYESSLRDCLHQKWQVEQGKDNPMVSTEFRNVSMHDKVDIVYSLCMYRLDAEDVADGIKGIHGEDMRIEPVGHDSEKSTYWNFNDERLYKETKPPEPPKEKHKKKHKKHKHKKKKGKHRDSVDSDDETPVVETPKYGEWSVVCSSEEEWNTFVKQLKKNKHKEDKKLRKVLVNDFLPLIAEIIVEKEKAMKKRMLEFLPKRESNRLARKKAEMDEQRSIMAKLDAEEREDDRRKEAEKRRVAEQRRKEEIAREREDRIRAREEERESKNRAREDRAMRALMREHKLASGAFDDSMSDESSEETDWEDYNRTGGGALPHRESSRRQNSRKKTSNNRPPTFGPKEYEKINRILYLIQRNSNCWPFLEPVTKDIAPDYLDVIEKPMDISAIRKKSSKKEYFSKQQFVADFHLIVENCTKYNGVNSDLTVMARSLKEKFDSLVEKSFPSTNNNDSSSKPRTQAQHNQEESSQDSADTADSRINYAENSSSETEGSEAVMSDSSQSSYGASTKPKKNNTSAPANRSRKPTNKKKNSKPASRVTQKSLSADSEESESSESEEETTTGNDILNFVMSHNSTSKPLTMSQSQQILMDTPISNTSSPARGMFGIARRQSTSQTSQPNYDIAATSHSHVTTQEIDTTNGHTSEDTASIKSPSLLSPPNSGNRLDRSTELARWMGKSPASTPKTELENNGTDIDHAINDNVKVQAIIKPPQAPFQGLFAQLKRSSVDTSPTEPPFKRVAS